MKLSWIIAAIVLASAGAWAAVQFSQPKELLLQTSFEFPTPQAIAPFSLTDQHGKAFTNDDLSGKWSLFFIGYTSCPDVCPTTMGKLTAAYPIPYLITLTSLTLSLLPSPLSINSYTQ